MKHLLLAVLAACTAHTTPKNVKAPEAGVTISVYAKDAGGYSVVDDRRWVEITGTSILLPNIDPGADLASLQIEPTTSALHVGSCTRERLPDLVFSGSDMNLEQLALLQKRGVPYAVRAKPEPIVQTKANARYAPAVTCEVSATPGRYLVRILYVSKTLRYRAQHDVELREPTRATVASRFAIETPPWRTRADVILFDGVPGGEKTPTEITRGSIDLDGTTAVLAIPERSAKAELRRIYDGAVINTDDRRDAMWAHDSLPSVWVWLELAALHLAPGTVHIHVDVPDEGIRDAEVAADKRQQADEADATLRLPLWIDSNLRGMRSRVVEYNDGAVLTERFVVGIANMGDVAREVFADEHLRPAKVRRVERVWPKKPPPAPGPDEVLRTKLSVAPGRVARAGYTMSYEF
jgi:hypothetical protein